MIPDNNILDIIISIVLIYALLSILVSVVIEWWQSKRRARSKHLRLAINQLLNDPLNLDFGALFYSHYQIDGMKNKEMGHAPAYIPSTVFAQVLMDIIAKHYDNRQPVTLVDGAKTYSLGNIVRPGLEPGTKSAFEVGLESLHPSPFSETIMAFWERANKNPSMMVELLAHWYDDYMDRVGGWFKSKQRSTFVVIGFAVAIALNVDSLHIIKVISIDDALRARLVATAEKVADEYVQRSDSAVGSSALLRTFNAVPLDTSKHLISPGDTSKVNVLIRTLRNDSVSRVSLQKADSVLGIVAALDIPIGWSMESAPVSWFTNFGQPKKKIPDGPGVLAYQLERNRLSFGSVSMYLFGMIISGYMLSFGAPFWFQTLTQVINIRRSGKKPEATNTKKS